MSTSDVIFEPLEFRNLTVKNRIFRSSISGRFDNYDGSGTQTRINWEEKFARGGVGAIISSFVPVHITGRILPNYATIDGDDKIPFWKAVGRKVHEYDCKYIIQLSHGGRQRDIPGVENHMRRGMSSTDRPDAAHGLPARAMTIKEIKTMVRWFADAARRAREAGLDGVELHASHGYLFTQFLSSAINDREDDYGGSTENRARLLLEVIHAIRKEVGDDFHLQAKINIVDYDDALIPWPLGKRGNQVEESVEICKMAEAAGLDALHASIGSMFPHPLMPPGGTPPDELNWWYGGLMGSGASAYFNYTLMHFRMLRPIFFGFWNRMKRKHPVEGICRNEAKAVKEALDIPVLCTGGFQDARLIREVLTGGYCDGVAIARPLIANNDLPQVFQSGADLPDRPCSFCNRCLVNAVANPLGCYDLRRFDDDRERMIEEIMTVFHPNQFSGKGSGPGAGGPDGDYGPAGGNRPADGSGPAESEGAVRG